MIQSERGQIAAEYFIIAMAIATLTLLGTATFHRQIKTTLMNFYESAVNAVGR